MGTTSRFAASPYCAARLKCAAAMGLVASPATRDEITSIATGRTYHGKRGDTRAHGPAVRISATVAAKLIWNPGDSRACGFMARISVPASATVRSEIARRSARIAPSIAATMTKARSVATPPPDIQR